MSTIAIPGPRDVRATLDGSESGEHLVVACPPHPQHGGNRRDARLRAVAEALADRGVSCLRIDYGPWDEGPGEVEDARRAIEWGRDRFDTVGLFGFSFGAGVAALAAARGADGTSTTEFRPRRLSILAPPSRIGPELETVPALESLSCPVQVIYGERDTTVDWAVVVERARELGHDVEGIPADHFFIGQAGKVAERIGDFFDSS